MTERLRWSSPDREGFLFTIESRRENGKWVPFSDGGWSCVNRDDAVTAARQLGALHPDLTLRIAEYRRAEP